MTIKEIEERSGMTRANIRFYEQEGLLSPVRRENGYRDYSEGDLEILKRILLLRTLHISLEEIKSLHAGERKLTETLECHVGALEQQQEDLEGARLVCLAMKNDGVQYETFNAQTYLTALERHVPVTASETPGELDSDRIPRVQAPWRRFFARSLDLAIYSLIWDLILMVVANVNTTRFGSRETMMSTIVVMVLMLIIEPLFLWLFGTTPGKWILGLKVLHYEERRLTYGEAATRTWGVLLWGMGLLVVPGFNLYRGWKSLNGCLEGDILPWEPDSLLVLRDQKRWRIAAWICARVLVFLVLVGLVTMAGQSKYRGDITVSQFCEEYNRLAAYYDMDNNRTLTEDGSFVKTPVYGNTVVISLGEMAMPEFEFVQEGGIMTGMSFTISHENTDLWANGCQEEMILSALAFLGGQRKARLSDGEGINIMEYIWEHPFEDFALYTGDAVMSCQVEYSGYMNTPEMGVLYLEEKEGEERENSFYLHFEMRKEAASKSNGK